MKGPRKQLKGLKRRAHVIRQKCQRPSNGQSVICVSSFGSRCFVIFGLHIEQKRLSGEFTFIGVRRACRVPSYVDTAHRGRGSIDPARQADKAIAIYAIGLFFRKSLTQMINHPHGAQTHVSVSAQTDRERLPRGASVSTRCMSRHPLAGVLIQQHCRSVDLGGSSDIIHRKLLTCKFLRLAGRAKGLLRCASSKFCYFLRVKRVLGASQPPPCERRAKSAAPR